LADIRPIVITLNISNSDILQFVWFSNVVLLFFLNLLWMNHAMPNKLVIWWKSHVFILAYIVNIILDWLINKGISMWCFSYWPSYRSSVCCIGLQVQEIRKSTKERDLNHGLLSKKTYIYCYFCWVMIPNQRQTTYFTI
jgi:hypothetical protein